LSAFLLCKKANGILVDTLGRFASLLFFLTLGVAPLRCRSKENKKSSQNPVKFFLWTAGYDTACGVCFLIKLFKGIYEDQE